MNNSSDKLSGSKPSRNATSGDVKSIPESEDAIRNLKASQSVEAAFQAAGIASPPGDVAAIITNQVRSAIQGLSIQHVANMSPGSGELATSAAVAVNQFMSSLTPSQREAVKAGVNPLDAAAMLKLNGGLKMDAGNFAGLAGRDSSARFDGMGAQGYTQTQIQARDLAIKSGLTWAVNNPDLLRLGPAAIQALADVHLRQDSYERFKNGGLSAKAIVAGARYAKKNHIDYNEASKAHEEAQQSLPAADRKVHSDAVTKFNESAGQPNAKPADEETAKKEFNESMDKLKDRNPSAKQKIEHQQRILKTVKQEEHAATAKADANVTAADAKATVAKKDVAAKQSTKSKWSASLD